MRTEPPNTGSRVDPVSRHMGRRLYRRREALQVSRSWFAALLDLTTEELRAREEGLARLDGKALYDVSVLLGVPMDYFVDGLEAPRRPQRLETLIRAADRDTPVFATLPAKRRAALLTWLEETLRR